MLGIIETREGVDLQISMPIKTGFLFAQCSLLFFFWGGGADNLKAVYNIVHIFC